MQVSISVINDLINSNDNLEHRGAVFKGVVKGKPNAYFKKYIPEATYLIKKHCTQSWKNRHHSVMYSLHEMMICTSFEKWQNDREGKIEAFAIMIECSPEALRNDPDLPF